MSVDRVQFHKYFVEPDYYSKTRSTRVEISQAVHDQTGIVEDYSNKAVGAAVEAIVEEIAKGGIFTLQGLGSFSTRWVRRKAPHVNADGNEIPAKPYTLLHFKPDAKLRKRISALGQKDV